MPPPYNPWVPPIFPNGAAFGTGSPAEEAQQPAGLSNFIGGLYSGLEDLARRAIGNSQTALDTGNYNPRAPLEAALLPMGTGAIAGVPVKGAEAVLGAGPIRAYHGSPYDFDRFDLSKIGTGEGAQAYGHGLYFAENEGVARQYRDVLSKPAIELNGQKIVPSRGSPEDIALAHLEDAFDAQSSAPYAKAYQSLLKARELTPVTPSMSARNDMDAAIRALSDWQEKGAKPGNAGKMYEVNINADPAHLLDWDKKVRDMPAEMQQRLFDKGLAEPHGGDIGSQIYHRRVDEFGPAAATQQLSEAGIPGVKYLDAGSRGAGQGSSNYVMFDDKLIDILKKYGLAGFAAPPIFANAVGDNTK